MTKRLLTIQDLSCVGQCSTTVALPLVSACGVECAVMPPAVLSNHTAPCFSDWTFRDLTDDLPRIEAMWLKLGVKFDAFYTGYVCESHIDPILSVMDCCGRPGKRVAPPPCRRECAVEKKFVHRIVLPVFRCHTIAPFRRLSSRKRKKSRSVAAKTGKNPFPGYISGVAAGRGATKRNQPIC